MMELMEPCEETALLPRQQGGPPSPGPEAELREGQENKQEEPGQCDELVDRLQGGSSGSPRRAGRRVGGRERNSPEQLITEELCLEGQTDEDRGEGGLPPPRLCHTHERAIPIQETVEALDITEEGRLYSKTHA